MFVSRSRTDKQSYSWDRYDKVTKTIASLWKHEISNVEQKILFLLVIQNSDKIHQYFFTLASFAGFQFVFVKFTGNHQKEFLLFLSFSQQSAIIKYGNKQTKTAVVPREANVMLMRGRINTALVMFFIHTCTYNLLERLCTEEY